MRRWIPKEMSKKQHKLSSTKPSRRDPIQGQTARRTPGNPNPIGRQPQRGSTNVPGHPDANSNACPCLCFSWLCFSCLALSCQFGSTRCRHLRQSLVLRATNWVGFPTDLVPFSPHDQRKAASCLPQIFLDAKFFAPVSQQRSESSVRRLYQTNSVAVPEGIQILDWSLWMLASNH